MSIVVNKISNYQTFGNTLSKPKNTSFNEGSTPLNSYSTQENKKEGLTKNQKILIGTGILTTIIGVGALLLKGKVGQAKTLAQNIKFTPAKTIEEARTFAKTHLGINNYELDDVDVANWLNEGLLNLKYKTKGNVKIPKSVLYESCPQEKQDELIAMWFKDGFLSDKIGINKEWVKSILRGTDEVLSSKKWNPFKTPDNQAKIPTPFTLYNPEKAKELEEIVAKTIQGTKLTFKEKVALLGNIGTFAPDLLGTHANYPKHGIRVLLKNIDTQIMKKHFKMTLKEFDALPIEQQKEIIKNLNGALLQEGIRSYKLNIAIKDSFHNIYHEIGHKQHSINNLESFVEHNDFSNNLNEVATALKVSNYATTNSTEFVAEVYSLLLQGVKLPEDVMNMYKKYKGPSIL